MLIPLNSKTVITLTLLGAAALGGAQAPAAAAGGESGLQAVASAQGGVSSNRRANNQSPLSGAEYELSSLLSYTRRSPAGSLQLRYEPYFEWYPAEAGLNSVSQVGAMTASWNPGPRWTLSGQASGGYMRIIPANTLSGLQPILSPQTETATPTTREETGQGQLQLQYQLSPRSAVFASGAYSGRGFPAGDIQGLTGLRQAEGGAGYTRLLSPRTRLGVEYDVVNASLGTDSHLAAHSLIVRWNHAFTPLTSLELYGGPEYSQVHDTYNLPLAGLGTLTAHMYRVRAYPRLGATLAHAGRLQWSAQADSRVSAGGGVMPFPAEMLDERVQIAPGLSPPWALRLGVQTSQLRALAGGSLAGRLWMAAAGADLSRNLNRHLTLEVQYEYTVQRTSGLIPMAPPITRSFVSAGLSWSWRPHPLTATGGQSE